MHAADLVPNALNVVEWTVDPSRPADPDHSQIHVLVTESACASGRPPGARLLGPQVIETADRVMIGVSSNDGDNPRRACPLPHRLVTFGSVPYRSSSGADHRVGGERPWSGRAWASVPSARSARRSSISG